MADDYEELSSFRPHHGVHFQADEMKNKEEEQINSEAQELILNLMKFGRKIPFLFFLPSSLSTLTYLSILLFFLLLFISLLLLLRLLLLDPSQRMTLDHVIHHSYLTDHETIDPFSLHFNPAIPLPISNLSNGSDINPQEDKEWARRQCSIVWAPMPINYDFTSTSNKTTQISGGKNKALDEGIIEMDMEFQAKF